MSILLKLSLNNDLSDIQVLVDALVQNAAIAQI